MVIKCKDCGAEFKLEEKEISWYAKRGWEIPKRCKACREKRKAEKVKNK